MPDSLEARALALLARREHSRAELQRKLAPHAESAEALAAVLDELVRCRKLSDERYAEMRVKAVGFKEYAAVEQGGMGYGHAVEQARAHIGDLRQEGLLCAAVG